MSSNIILHHYPQSPVSEKVRIAFGIKGISWHSVEIPRLPPKPDLMPLTGGYRRTPVMQIGADIYCDSACILAALERHEPEPTLFPQGPGRSWALCRWVETGLLDGAIRIVLGHDPQGLPEAFAKDRGRLYFGPDHDLDAIHNALPETIAQLAGQLDWLQQWLSAGAPFIEGEKPGMADCFAYYILWFLRGRWPDGAAFIGAMPDLAAWEARMAAFGNGSPADMAARDALEVARSAASATPASIECGMGESWRAGQKVAVVPIGDGGDPAVMGQLRYLDRQSVALEMEGPQTGAICVHFPKIGYRIFAA